MRIEYTLTEQDYLQAIKVHNARRPGAPAQRFPVWAAVLVGIGIAMIALVVLFIIAAKAEC